MMNVRVAKEELALMLPTAPSGFSQPGFAPARMRSAGQPGFAARLAGLAQRVLELPRRRAVMDELATLTDRELADIGLTRDCLSDVFEPGFADARRTGTDRGFPSRS